MTNGRKDRGDWFPFVLSERFLVFPILCHALRSLIPVLFVRFLGVYTSSAVRKDGNPTGLYSEEEGTKPVVLKRDRSKSNIILHSTAKFSFAAKQLFIPTTDFAGNTLWSFLTPRSFHLRTRWPSLTSLLLLPTRFRSASQSPGNRTTPTFVPKSGHLSTKTLHHHGKHLRLHGKGQS